MSTTNPVGSPNGGCLAVVGLVLFIVAAGFALTPWGNGAIDAVAYRVTGKLWLLEWNDSSVSYCRGFTYSAEIVGGDLRPMPNTPTRWFDNLSGQIWKYDE